MTRGFLTQGWGVGPLPLFHHVLRSFHTYSLLFIRLYRTTNLSCRVYVKFYLPVFPVFALQAGRSTSQGVHGYRVVLALLLSNIVSLKQRGALVMLLITLWFYVTLSGGLEILDAKQAVRQ